MPTVWVYFGPPSVPAPHLGGPPPLPMKPVGGFVHIPDPAYKKWNPQALKKAGWVLAKKGLPRLVPFLGAALTAWEIYENLSWFFAPTGQTVPNPLNYNLAYTCTSGPVDRWRNVHVGCGLSLSYSRSESCTGHTRRR